MILYKEPNESKIFGVDFTTSLITGETISTATVVSDTSGLTIGSVTIASGIIKFRISGGTDGIVYGLTASIVTSDGNTYEECLSLSVKECDSLFRLVTMLRVLINDLEVDQTYSDTRLKQVLCVAAQQLQVHLDFDQTYTIDIAKLEISPDPSDPSTQDDAFMALLILKAACFIDTNALRTKAALAGLRATLGSLSLDTNNSLQGFIKMMELGPCAGFDDLAKDYVFSNSDLCRAILSPFVNNQFDPRNLSSSYSERDRGYWFIE